VGGKEREGKLSAAEQMSSDQGAWQKTRGKKIFPDAESNIYLPPGRVRKKPADKLRAVASGDNLDCLPQRRFNKKGEGLLQRRASGVTLRRAPRRDYGYHHRRLPGGTIGFRGRGHREKGGDTVDRHGQGGELPLQIARKRCREFQGGEQEGSRSSARKSSEKE